MFLRFGSLWGPGSYLDSSDQAPNMWVTSWLCTPVYRSQLWSWLHLGCVSPPVWRVTRISPVPPCCTKKLGRTRGISFLVQLAPPPPTTSTEVPIGDLLPTNRLLTHPSLSQVTSSVSPCHQAAGLRSISHIQVESQIWFSPTLVTQTPPSSHLDTPCVLGQGSGDHRQKPESPASPFLTGFLPPGFHTGSWC